MHADRLQKVREIILVHKDRFKYSVILDDSGDYDDPRYGRPLQAKLLLEDCHTVGCVAGWTCALFDPEANYSAADNLAQDLLGLTDNESIFLFFGGEVFGEPAISLREATVDDVIRRIDILLERATCERN